METSADALVQALDYVERIHNGEYILLFDRALSVGAILADSHISDIINPHHAIRADSKSAKIASRPMEFNASREFGFL